MGQQSCKPILQKCGACCQDLEIADMFGCNEGSFGRNTVLRRGDSLPLLADDIRLVTECTPPEGLMEYDLILVNQVNSVCGQLSDGDLTPFMRSKIVCESTAEKHVACFDTNRLHDEVVALCIVGRYAPHVKIESCSVYVKSSGMKERMMEFKTTDVSKEQSQAGRVFLAMVHTSNSLPMWYFKAVNQEIDLYTQDKVCTIAGKAVEGEDDSEAPAAKRASSVYTSQSTRRGADNASVQQAGQRKSDNTVKTGGQRRGGSGNYGDININEGTTDILNTNNAPEPSGGGWFKMPELSVPGGFGRQSRGSTQTDDIDPNRRNITAQIPELSQRAPINFGAYQGSSFSDGKTFRQSMSPTAAFRPPSSNTLPMSPSRAPRNEKPMYHSAQTTDVKDASTGLRASDISGDYSFE